jgi:hypothetical protein
MSFVLFLDLSLEVWYGIVIGYWKFEFLLFANCVVRYKGHSLPVGINSYFTIKYSGRKLFYPDELFLSRDWGLGKKCTGSSSVGR